ncbi:uncharacterized protein LOC119370398 [Jatropha curcas]|uniref:uncharacterized protein LOC119370398 n=1 Tax=Jatropha curcas TaxID=180498 RepID=UPI00189356AE|nr:uncharacterized protein LOC119370398 [Jatropha curcas]
MADDKTLTKLPHFDGHYDHWSELMENLLRAKGLWNLVEQGFTEPTEGTKLTEAQQAELDDAKTKDYQVKHYLFQAIDRTVFEQILDRRTSKIVWDSLKRKFGGNQKVKKSLLNALRREFEILEMRNDETITEYFARSSLVVHEQKFRRPSNSNEDQVLKIEGRSSTSNRGRGGYRGRGRGRGRTNFDKATVECYRCHDLGHFQYECPKKNEANYTELDEEDEMLLMAYNGLRLKQHESKKREETHGS